MACREVKNVVWSHPATDNLMKMFNGYRSTLAIIPACELKLFDKLQAHPNGISAEQLAEQHSWHAGNTARLLDAMAAHDLLDKAFNDDGTVTYQNSESGKYLISNVKGSYEGIYTKFSKMLEKSMAAMADEVRTGAKSDKPHWALPTPLKDQGQGHKQEHGHGRASADDKGQGRGHGGASADDKGKGHGHGHGDQQEEHSGKDNANSLYMYGVFEAMMLPHVNELVTAFDLKAYKRAVDIGGGTGLLSYALSRNYPEMKITMVEMASVIQVANEFKPDDFDQLNVDFLEGNCFELDLPTADLYVMSKVLHHFTEQKMDELLTRLYNKLPSGGSVMLLEDTFNTQKTGGRPTHCFDMMMMARGVGKNRSAEEYMTILERNNFATIKCLRSNPECMFDVILAIKA